MLSVVVVDSTAESRNRIVQQLHAYIETDIPERDIIPRVTIRPLSRNELKFHAAPDVCIIGDELISAEIADVAAIRKLLPDAAIIARLTQRQASLATIEQLARFGVDDTLLENTLAPEFLRKLVLISRRAKKVKSGQLILVDSGKGGLGVTSIVAALGEALSAKQKRVALLDFDFETQDLSRFLQARPFVNENLQLLFSGHRPITQEFVDQALVQVWSDDDYLWCVPPLAESEDLYDSRSNHARSLVSILEIIDSSFDCVLVDAGSARGSILKTLYRVADQVVFVINNDPATLYASVDRLARLRTVMAPDANLLVLENASTKSGLPLQVLRQEFSRAARLEPEAWISTAMPQVKHASRWPGSGGTLFSHGGAAITESCSKVLVHLGLIQDEKSAESRSGIETILSLLKRRKAVSTETESRPALPGSTLPGSTLPANFNEPLQMPALARLELPEPTKKIESKTFEESKLNRPSKISESQISVSEPAEDLDPVRLVSGAKYS